MSMFHELMMKKKGIPSRYQEVEYIESTGTQYIDTGVLNLDQDCEISCEYMLTQTPPTTDYAPTMFGARGSGVEVFLSFSGYQQNSYANFGDITQFTLNCYTHETKYKFKINKTNITVNNNIIRTYTAGDFICNINSLKIFCTATESFKTSARLYSFTISKNNVFIRNFIPVYDTLTQKYGMWESVQGKFYGNDGTGDFKGSIVGYTVVGSPTITDGVVSGFSASDYVSVPIFSPTGKWKCVVGFTYSSQNTGTTYIFGNTDSFVVKTYNNALQVALKVNGSSSFNFNGGIGKILLDGEKCYCSVEFTGEKYIFSWSSDGINWVFGNEYTSTTNIRTDKGLSYGRVSNTVWLGTIIIKDSLIYQNNKLWFNGQQS